MIDLVDDVDSRQQRTPSPYGRGRGATPPQHRQSNNHDHLTPSGQRQQPPHDQERHRGYTKEHPEKINQSYDEDRHYNNQRRDASNDNARRGYEDERRGHESSSVGRHQNEEPRGREYDGNGYNREEERGAPIRSIAGDTRIDDDRLSG